MKNLFTVITLSLAVSTTATASNTDWWGVGAAVVGVGIALSKESRNQDVRDAGRTAEIITGSVKDGQGLKKHIYPSQYEANPGAYGNWIKVNRAYNRMFPEMDQGRCIYRMNAGMIEFNEPVGGCPKYVAVHPNNFY